MPGALTSGLPQAPMEPQPMQPQGGAPQQQQAQQQPPVLSHQQAVAALRHFHAIDKELMTLLKDPDLGRADLKSAIIDGATGLVANRIIAPGQAVAQLADVPEKPRDQKKWVEQHYQQNKLAANTVLDHYRQANPDPRAAIAAAAQPHDPDQHMRTMSGVMAAYKGPNNG